MYSYKCTPGCLNHTYAVKDNEARDDMAAPDMADGQEADNDAHMAADVEADIEVVKATAPEAEEEAGPAAAQEADPAAEAEGDPAAEAERPSPFKPNPKDRLAGKVAVIITAHTHSLLVNLDDFITCVLCCH
jgi:uncharacterized membrane protein